MKAAIIVLTLSAIALASLAAAYSDSATELRPGWNLVAWTGDTTDGVEAAYGWNPATQLFDRYFPDRPDVSTLTQLDEGQAYWILASRSAVLSAIGPNPAPCPECPVCAEPTPCATGYDWECSQVYSRGMGLERDIEFCKGMHFPYEYAIEELAVVEAYLNEHCR